MTISDKLASLLRTWIPIGVGALLTWLATRYGIVLDESTSATLAIGVTGLVSAAYYTLVRAAETRWRWAGVLLGWTAQPMYVKYPEPQRLHH